MQDHSITCDLVSLPQLLLFGEQLADTESSDIKEIEWEYSSQTGCALFILKVYQLSSDANTFSEHKSPQTDQGPSPPLTNDKPI